MKFRFQIILTHYSTCSFTSGQFWFSSRSSGGASDCSSTAECQSAGVTPHHTYQDTTSQTSFIGRPFSTLRGHASSDHARQDHTHTANLQSGNSQSAVSERKSGTSSKQFIHTAVLHRMSDITQSPGGASNQQPDNQRREEQGES